MLPRVCEHPFTVLSSITTFEERWPRHGLPGCWSLMATEGNGGIRDETVSYMASSYVDEDCGSVMTGSCQSQLLSACLVDVFCSLTEVAECGPS